MSSDPNTCICNRLDGGTPGCPFHRTKPPAPRMCNACRIEHPNRPTCDCGCHDAVALLEAPRIVAECIDCPYDTTAQRAASPRALYGGQVDRHRAAGHDVRPVEVR